jgi:adenylate cyclase
MFTDMVGYTALGQRNESLSLALVEEQKKLIRPILSRHNGREVKTIGDSFMVEFPNALDAVKCAYEIQRVTREANFSLPEDRRLHLRIGIHLGDVVESEDDISGDAVNIASRIEALADDGGVCITQQVFDQVQNKFDLPLLSMGPRNLKNVKSPVSVFMVSLPWVKAAQQPLPDKRRIAILPFANVSPDPQDEYFADGITDELISTISRIRELRVIARTSAMKYKGSGKGVAEIGRELQVGFIVEGTVRKAGNRLRIGAQLVDPETEEHRWAETYDRELQDVFAIQSDIAARIGSALRIKLLADERSDIERKATGSSKAYTLYLKGRYFWNERTKEGLDKALVYFEKAIETDPGYALAHAGLADCYVIYGDYDWMRPTEAFTKGLSYALRAIELDSRLSEPHASLGVIYNNFEGRWRDAEEEFRTAIELKPSYAIAHMWYGLLLMTLERYADAAEELKQAKRLDPLSRLPTINLALLLISEGRPKEAIEEFTKMLEENSDWASLHTGLGWALYYDSRPREAIEELRRATSLSGRDPRFMAELACILGLAGQRGEAEELLSELTRLSSKAYVSKMALAKVFFCLERLDDAYDRLEEAREEKSIFAGHGGDFHELRTRPWYARARVDRRWGLMMERLGLTP